MFSEQAMRCKLEVLECQVSRCVYPADTAFPAHIHGIDKIDTVLSGRFCMTIGGMSVVLESGDCLVVPRRTVHSAEVGGDRPVVKHAKKV